MDNNHLSKKKNVGGIVLDILTIGMLFASFTALFYSGFILKAASFPLGALCAITAAGMLLLFFIGNISCLSSKTKNDSLSVGFLVFSAVQLVALIVNLALLLGLMIKLFSVDDLASRLTYVITVSLVLIGYVASISYFSAGNAADTDDEEDDSKEDYSEDDEEEDSDEEEVYEEDEENPEDDSEDELYEYELSEEEDSDDETDEDAADDELTETDLEETVITE